MVAAQPVVGHEGRADTGQVEEKQCVKLCSYAMVKEEKEA